MNFLKIRSHLVKQSLVGRIYHEGQGNEATMSTYWPPCSTQRKCPKRCFIYHSARTYTSEHSRKFGEQPDVHCTSKTANISSLIVGIGFVLVARYYYKRRLVKELEELKQDDSKTFKLPHVNKAADTLVLHKSTWLSKALFPDEKLLTSINNFQLRDGDVLVCSFPKSGTTWLQEIVYLINSGVNSMKEKPTNMEERFPYIEYIYPGLKDLAARPSPRMLKTHLPYDLLPERVKEGKNKVIYIARNPKDVIVSYFHFVVMLSYTSFTGSIGEFAECFLKGSVPYGPWPDHVQGFWHHRNDKNVLFITYEDLHKDPGHVISEVANFLGIALSTDDIKVIAQRTSFESMKGNENSNYSWWDDLGIRNKGATSFMRKGRVGDWKLYLSDSLAKEVDSICEKQLKPLGLELADSV